MRSESGVKFEVSVQIALLCEMAPAYVATKRSGNRVIHFLVLFEGTLSFISLITVLDMAFEGFFHSYLELIACFAVFFSTCDMGMRHRKFVIFVSRL